jgi:hypothetical protein
LSCLFDQKPILSGGKIALLHSWENIVLAQFSIDKSLKYYICDMKKCTFSLEFFHFSPISHLSHETLQKGKNGSDILEAFMYEETGIINILAQKLSVNNILNEITNHTIC